VSPLCCTARIAAPDADDLSDDQESTQSIYAGRILMTFMFVCMGLFALAAAVFFTIAAIDVWKRL
jgi:hypothetical protein